MSQPKCPKCGDLWVCPHCGRVDSNIYSGRRLPPKIEKRRNTEHQVKKPKKWSEMDEYERESKFADYLGWFMLIAFLAAMLIGTATTGEQPEPFLRLFEK